MASGFANLSLADIPLNCTFEGVATEFKISSDKAFTYLFQ